MGQNNSDIRISNRNLILKIIARHSYISRIQLAELSGLTKTTITNLTSELMEHDIISDASPDELNNLEVTANSVGRRRSILTLSKTSPLIAGIEIKRSKLTFALTELNGNCLNRREYALSNLIPGEKLIEKLIECMDDLLSSTDRRVLGIGVSALGPIDCENGVMLNPRRFFTEDTMLDLRTPLSTHFHLPLVFMHDAQADALRELLYNKDLESENFGLLLLDNGIGMGLCLNGKLYHGQQGLGGEFGHTGIMLHGRNCPCGNNGCLETYANDAMLIHYAEDILPHYKQRRHPNSPNLSNIFYYAEAGDPACLAALGEYCKHVSYALTSVINLLNLPLIVISSPRYPNSQILAETIEAQVNSKSITGQYSPIKVRHTVFPKDSSGVSANAIIAEQIFNGQLLLY